MESVEGWSNAYDPTNKAKKAHGGTSHTHAHTSLLLAMRCFAIRTGTARIGPKRQWPVGCVRARVHNGSKIRGRRASPVDFPGSVDASIGGHPNPHNTQ